MKFWKIIMVIFVAGLIGGWGLSGAEDKGDKRAGFHQGKPKPLTEEQIKKAMEEPEGKTPHKVPRRGAAQKEATVKMCLACHQPVPEAPQDLEIQEKGGEKTGSK